MLIYICSYILNLRSVRAEWRDAMREAGAEAGGLQADLPNVLEPLSFSLSIYIHIYICMNIYINIYIYIYIDIYIYICTCTCEYIYVRTDKYAPIYVSMYTNI